jgi:hypothetical protein
MRHANLAAQLPPIAAECDRLAVVKIGGPISMRMRIQEKISMRMQIRMQIHALTELWRAN